MGVKNFSVYVSHKLVPPALKALLNSSDVHVDGFILPGHVSTIIGRKPYEFLAEEYRKPSVITGFEATEIIEGILMIVRQIAQKRADVEIQYTSVVRERQSRAVALLDSILNLRTPIGAVSVSSRTGSSCRTGMHHLMRTKFNPPPSTASEPELCSCQYHCAE
jgi:hydrogenase expression/formation protein HypD